MRTIALMIVSLVMGMFLIPEIVVGDGEVGKPVDRGDGVLQTAGDWTIIDSPGPPIEYENVSIIVNGNLTIENGATLILRNVTLMMNSTNYDGECNIEVLNGGTLSILDGSNIMDSPYDVDDGSASDYEFMFWVRDGASFTMKDSELHECGWDWDDVGLTIETDGTLIENNTISNNFFGIRSSSNYNIILGNNISNNYNGIYLISSSYNNIIDNNVSLNLNHGIELNAFSNSNLILDCDISNNGNGIIGQASYNKISNSTISSNMFAGINLGGSSEYNTFTNCDISNNDLGIQLAYSKNNQIQNCNIFLNNNCGVKLLSFADYNRVTNSSIVNNGYGIEIDASQNCTITNNSISSSNNCAIWLNSYHPLHFSTNNTFTNCTISGSDIYDFYFDDNSSAYTINTTFDKSKVHFLDQNSTLTVKWYMHVRAESTNGLPISEANIEVTNTTGDPAQGSPFKTGDDGFTRWIVVTEYVQNDTNKVYSTPHNVTATLSGSTGYAEPYMDSSKVVIIVLDTERPIADADVDASINEDEPHTFDGSGSTDNIGIVNWTWDFGDGTFGYGERPTHTYTTSNFYVVVLNVSDATGRWDTDTVSIFVNNVPPIADCGSDKVGDEDEQLTFDGSNSTDTPSDIDSLFYTWYFGDGAVGCGKVVNHSYEDNGTYIVTLQVTDDDGAISVDSITVTINNTVPKISPVEPQFLQEGEPYTLQIKATDAKGDILTFSDNSTMFDIDPITGVISFTPINADVGVHLVNITVVDDDDAESYIEIWVMVQNTNDAPIITSSPVTVAVENSTYYYNLSVRDDDMDTIIYTLDLKPEGMSIDSEGRISWTPTNQQASQTFMVIVNVSDSKDFDTQTFSVTVMNVNDSPTITSTPILSATEDVPYNYNVDAVDLDIGDRPLYSLDTAPKGMDIDSSTGLISWIPTNTQVGDNVVVVNVTDSTGAFITQEFTITVSNSNDAPVLEPIGTLEATEEQPFYYQVVGYDVDLNDVLSFYDDSELFDIGENTGIIFFTPSNDDVGTYTLTITVVDSSGAEDSETITLTVLNVNDPPILDPISNQQLIEGTPFNLTITASDPDRDDSIVFIDNTTLFDINPLTGEISFTPTNQDVGEHHVTITVIDREGESDHVTATITIQGAESETSPDYIWWILLIIVIMLEAFIIVYLMKKRTEVNMVSEPKEEEPKEIEMELEEPMEEEKTPPPPPPPEEPVEFETAGEESTENEGG